MIIYLNLTSHNLLLKKLMFALISPCISARRSLQFDPFWACPCSRYFKMKTFSAKAETVERDWFVVDANGKTLGRLATKVASILRGKHKPEFTPHVDTGDYIVVVNAEKIGVTGNKSKGKIYYSHTGYPGGIKDINFEDLIEKAPERVIQSAVKGMLPKGPLGREMFRKLKVYAGSEHPHASQQPQILEI